MNGHRKIQMGIFGLVTAVLALTFAVMRPFAASCSSVREKVLRLHVLADSDSPADQKLKLQVRNAILRESEEIFADAGSREEAVAAATEALPRLKAAGDAALIGAGSGDRVHVELCRMYFTKRIYEDGTTLPAGNYEALRVIVGSGRGKNWWCMLFPKLCLSAASAEENKASLSSVFTEEEVKITTESEKYTVRFFLLDLWEELKHRLLGTD